MHSRNRPVSDGFLLRGLQVRILLGSPPSGHRCKGSFRLSFFECARGPNVIDAASRRSSAGSMVSVIFSAWHDPAARILNVDLLAVLIAILMPWSTTGAVIAIVMWVVAVI